LVGLGMIPKSALNHTIEAPTTPIVIASLADVLIPFMFVLCLECPA
jgi:hypothetical protein